MADKMHSTVSNLSTRLLIYSGACSTCFRKSYICWMPPAACVMSPTALAMVTPAVNGSIMFEDQNDTHYKNGTTTLYIGHRCVWRLGLCPAGLHVAASASCRPTVGANGRGAYFGMGVQTR